jgi:pyruvate/2-oxoglutarate dehydrogenase complex dihydrolipoamide acyltransferase (E2) component
LHREARRGGDNVRVARFASRRARELAAELGLEDVALIGTGTRGRITIDDVRKAAPPPPPPTAGEELRGRLLERYTFEPHEHELLELLVKTTNEVAVMEQRLAEVPATIVTSRGQERAHPLWIEVRAHRALQARLFGALRLRDAHADVDTRQQSQVARRLALRRWEG